MDQNRFYQKHIKDHNYLEVLADVELVSEDGWKFDVHQVILAQKSIFFRDLFCIYRHDPDSVSIPIRGNILNEILYFVYTETVEFNKDNFIDIMIASDYLQIDKLELRAKEFAKSVLSTENCFKIYVASIKVGYEHLQELCFRIIQTNFNRMVESNETDFVEIPPECLKKILSDKSLRVSGEQIVWESILKWANRDPNNRFKEVSGFLKCLKFKDIEESLANEIITVISNNPYCEMSEEIELQNFVNNLDALKSIVENYPETHPIIPVSDFYDHRLPDFLHVFCIYEVWVWIEDANGIFVTYDDRVDIWRKLSDVDIHDVEDDEPPFIHLIGSDIYVFGVDIRTYDLYENEWHIMQNTFDVSQWADSVTLRNSICFISHISIDDRLKVKFYNTENGQWSDTTFMSQISSFKSVSSENKIYVLGHATDNINMLLQVYDEDSKAWSVVSPPSTYRHAFSFVEYHGKLYVIGGVDNTFEYVNMVEVFDTLKNEWSRIGDLPFNFEHDFVHDPVPIAYVFNDRLIVIDNSYNQEEQYVLNETSKTWEKETNELRLEYEYMQNMYTISDRQLIKALVKENRKPETSLDENPFQMYELSEDE